MNLDYSMKMTQEQRLILTQNMQQSIKLLQMSLHDLREYIDNEYSENPVLEVNEEIISYEDAQTNGEMSTEDRYDYKKMVEELYSDNYKDKSETSYSNEEISPLNFIEKKISLKDYLQEQLVEVNIDQYTLSICKYIVESLDYRGYLEISIEELAEELNISEEVVEKALKVVQSLEPYGIGARNIKECLLIQSLKLNILDNIIERIILNHLENVAENKYEVVGKDLNISPREAQRYGDLIKKLEPKPSRGFYTGEEVNYIIPDAEIKNIDGEFFILMNESVLPRLMINKTYKDVLENNKDSEPTTAAMPMETNPTFTDTDVPWIMRRPRPAPGRPCPASAREDGGLRKSSVCSYSSVRNQRPDRELVRVQLLLGVELRQIERLALVDPVRRPCRATGAPRRRRGSTACP